MKKHLYYFLITFLIYSDVTYSQISLGTNDFPKSARIYNFSTALSFSGMDAALTGPNYTWDYTQLATTMIGSTADTFISVAQTAQLYAVYFAFGSHFSNQAVAGTNFSLANVINVTNAFNFFYNSSSSYSQTGFGANINGIPTPIGYSPLDVVYKYPVNFGNTDSSNSSYSISIPGFMYYGVNKTRHNVVDGWGTLQTPFGTFDALRIKSTIDETDSVYLDSLNFGYGGIKPPVRTEYKWLGAGKGAPLLEIDLTGGIVTRIIYQDSIRTSAVIAQEKPAVDFTIFPNPALGEVYLQYTLPSASDALIEITDLLGTVIVSAERKNQGAGLHSVIMEIPSSAPASANYLVRLSYKGGAIVKPLMIAK